MLFTANKRRARLSSRNDSNQQVYSEILQPLPRGFTLRSDEEPETVAFLSGATLAALDVVLRDPGTALSSVFLRDRLALDAAVACLKLGGRNEAASHAR